VKPKRDILGEGLVGLGICALGIFAFIYSGTFPSLRNGLPGPGLFPRIVAGGMALIGAALAIQAGRLVLLKHYSTHRLAPTLTSEMVVTWARGTAIPLAVVTYMLVVNVLGFLATMGTISLVLFLVLGTSVRTAVLGTAISTGAIYLLFARLLSVPLPGWGGS